jgi:hypothetical protein
MLMLASIQRKGMRFWIFQMLIPFDKESSIASIPCVMSPTPVNPNACRESEVGMLLTDTSSKKKSIGVIAGPYFAPEFPPYLFAEGENASRDTR